MFKHGDCFTFFMLVIASLSTGVFSIPSNVRIFSNVEKGIFERDYAVPRTIGGGGLRILCLGASITHGYKSSDGNGYRYGLRKALVEDGNIVNMIGSVSSGTMLDNQVEGWDGYRIAEVAAKAELSLLELPNVVCILVGTNDMLQNYNIESAADRLATLVDRIFYTVPGVTIIISTLPPTSNSTGEANVLKYNAGLVSVVHSRSTVGKRITLVDMHTSQFSLTDLGSDGIHPTDAGYQKIATVFYNGIKSMSSFIQTPGKVAGVDDAAAPNDKGTKITVQVNCLINVALSSSTCASTTKSPEACDPNTLGCPYGATTTSTSSQLSSIVPTTLANAPQKSAAIVALPAVLATISTVQLQPTTSKEPTSVISSPPVMTTVADLVQQASVHTTQEFEPSRTPSSTKSTSATSSTHVTPVVLTSSPLESTAAMVRSTTSMAPSVIPSIQEPALLSSTSSSTLSSFIIPSTSAFTNLHPYPYPRANVPTARPRRM